MTRRQRPLFRGPLHNDPARKARVVELYRAGNTIRQTAALAGTSYTTAQCVLEDEHVEIRRRGGSKRG